MVGNGGERTCLLSTSNLDPKQNVLSAVRSSEFGAPPKPISEKTSSSTARTSSSSGKKKKRRKSAKKDTDAAPKVGPWLEKLHLVNNGIDGFGAGKSYAPVICMRLVRKWISSSTAVKEINLDDNSIGDLAAREIALGLQERKENDLDSVKMYVTHCVNSETFTTIMTLGSGKSGKKKKGKGKAGKKKI